MPFVAECILCRQKVRLPDRAVGASVECPRCHSYFTAAPEHNPIPVARRPEPQPAPIPVAAAVGAAPAAQPPLATLPETDPPLAALPEPETPLAALPEPAPPRLLIPVDMPRPRPARRGVDPIGLGAIVIGTAALGCVWFFALCFLVIPLAVLGLLVGLVALAVGLLTDRPRYVLATAACTANALVLGAALFCPSLLGPTYELSRARAEVEVVVPRAVPLAGLKGPATEADAEWPDASRFAVQIRRIRVQVVGAAVRPLEIAQTPKRKFTKENYLALRVRVHQPAGGSEFASDAWGQDGTAQERRQPVLTDNTGKAYPPAPAKLATEASRLTQHSAIFPLGVTDEVFLFEAPTPDVTYLHLEMSAAPGGGSGAIRFTIPRTMLQFELPKIGKERP